MGNKIAGIMEKAISFHSTAVRQQMKVVLRQGTSSRHLGVWRHFGLSTGSKYSLKDFKTAEAASSL